MKTKTQLLLSIMIESRTKFTNQLVKNDNLC